MKILKIFIITFLIIIFLSGVSVSAENETTYEDLYNISGADNLKDNLPSETKELLEQLETDFSSIENFKNFNIKNIFKVILNCITDGIKTPVKIFSALLGIMLTFTLIDTSFEGKNIYGGSNIFITLVISVILINPLAGLIESTVNILKSLSLILTLVMPVLSGILISMGRITSASGASKSVLGVSAVMSQFTSFFLAPAAKTLTCLGIVGSVSKTNGILSFCEKFKKTVLWGFSTLSAVFLTVLGLQTAVLSSADGVAFKTTKTLVGSLIPIMGPMIAETLSLSGGCLAVLRTGVGIYGILALILTVLPILISLIIWKFFVWGITVAGELLGQADCTLIFKTVDFCLTVLIGSVIFILLVYVISLGIILGG